MFRDLISLFFPNICLACSAPLQKFERCVCTSCNYHLPKTNFHKEKENAITQIFWGRINIYSAASYFYFQKAGKVQHLIHQLKYKGQQVVGEYIGEIYGNELKNAEYFKNIDFIVPVPLHPKKLKKRGYNQSECFARGISKSMNAPIVNDLQRNFFTETQTKKSRFERWRNVGSVFELTNKEKYINKQILIVDDVITTGATIEACAQHFAAIEGVKISVVTIAYASNL
ncbi:MAG: phosphoribosyltransferase family protein [Bacteroidota bacterium]